MGLIDDDHADGAMDASGAASIAWSPRATRSNDDEGVTVTEPTPDLLRLLLDEREISRVLLAFSRCIDTKDFDGYAKLFAEDGELVTPWGGHRGREGLSEYVRGDLGAYAGLQHVSAGHEISVDGDSATARTTLLATHVTSDTGTEFWTVGGFYLYEFARVDGLWRITRAQINPVWRFDNTPAIPEGALALD